MMFTMIHPHTATSLTVIYLCVALYLSHMAHVMTLTPRTHVTTSSTTRPLLVLSVVPLSRTCTLHLIPLMLITLHCTNVHSPTRASTHTLHARRINHSATTRHNAHPAHHSHITSQSKYPLLSTLVSHRLRLVRATTTVTYVHLSHTYTTLMCTPPPPLRAITNYFNSTPTHLAWSHAFTRHAVVTPPSVRLYMRMM